MLNVSKPGKIVTPKEICEELQLDRRAARARLRLALVEGRRPTAIGNGRKPGEAGLWRSGAPAERQVRDILAAQ